MWDRLRIHYGAYFYGNEGTCQSVQQRGSVMCFFFFNSFWRSVAQRDKITLFVKRINSLSVSVILMWFVNDKKRTSADTSHLNICTCTRMIAKHASATEFMITVLLFSTLYYCSLSLPELWTNMRLALQSIGIIAYFSVSTFHCLWNLVTVFTF